MTRARRADLLAAAGLGLVAFLPFLRGTLAGACLYFRDLAVGFLPQRRFALDGLLGGDVPLWNPFLHEGVPLSLPAVSYLPDLLQLLRPDEAGISLVLALHVPLAALAFYVLARRLFSLPEAAAAGGGLVYGLGGFLLSTVNLYVLLEAAAWAPLLVLALAETAARPTRRGVALASLATGIAVSTTGVEIVAQSVVVGAVLGLRRGSLARGLGRVGAALALGALLAAPVLVLVAAQVGSSARGSGLATEVVLAHSVHPFTLVQTMVGGLYGNLGNLAGEWWGQNFFPRGFPYILSLYLGAPALAVAAVGASGEHPLRRRVLVLAVVALVASLGRFAGLSPLVDAMAVLRLFRYPVKVFFTVHLAVALLVGAGIDELASARARRAWSRLAAAAAVPGMSLAVLPLLPTLFPGHAAAFAAAFFPPGFVPAVRAMLLHAVTLDAATGGALALAVATLALLARSGRLPATRAALFVVLLVGGDLLRTGSGLNPMVSRAFFTPSPALAERIGEMRRSRVFTCPFETSAAYQRARLARGTAHEVWTFATALETLSPATNVPLRVPTAMSLDLTMLVPEERVLPASSRACSDLDALVPRLRRAGVDTVLSLDPLSHPDLVLADEWSPARVSPLTVRRYRLIGALPQVAVATRVVPVPDGAAGRGRAAEAGFQAAGGAAVEGATRVDGARGRVVEAAFSPDAVSLVVEADRPTVAVVRDGWASGWTATVNGEAAPVLRVDGRHRGVAVPAGRSMVSMRYRPRLLPASVGLAVLALLGAGALAAGLRPRGGPHEPPRDSA